MFSIRDAFLGLGLLVSEDRMRLWRCAPGAPPQASPIPLTRLNTTGLNHLTISTYSLIYESLAPGSSFPTRLSSLSLWLSLNEYAEAFLKDVLRASKDTTKELRLRIASMDGEINLSHALSDVGLTLEHLSFEATFSELMRQITIVSGLQSLQTFS